MQFSREQVENELRGYYRTGCFHIYLHGSFDEDLKNMSLGDLSMFTHEYVHYLQTYLHLMVSLRQIHATKQP